MQKRILAISDISCVGKCSLTVALPIISALKIECSILPTAILSTHTSEFKGYTFYDNTENIAKISEHWIKEKFLFDGIYIGYISSPKQAGLIMDLTNTLKTKDTFILVDPILAEDGKLYEGFSEINIKETKKLITLSDIITPNIYEASILTNTKINYSSYTQKEVESIINKLVNDKAKNVIITGVSFNDSQIGTAYYNAKTKKINYCLTQKFDGKFYGTGDIFASTLCAYYAKTNDIDYSVKKSTDFLNQCILSSVNDSDNKWYGVNFEENIDKLT